MSMFATHEAFKFPFQFDKESTTWRAVELRAFKPWLIAVVEDGVEEASRAFLVSGVTELMQLISGKSIRKVCSVDLVLPPLRLEEGQWRFVPIRRVERELRSVDGATPSAVLTTTDGQRYGGFPIESVEREESDLTLAVELPGVPVPTSEAAA